MESLLIFIGFTIMSLCANIGFYSYKKRKYELNRIRVLNIGLLICTAIFLVINLPFFITNSSDSFFDKDQGYFIPTVLFNLANILYSASVILFLLAFLQIDENVIDLEIPSKNFVPFEFDFETPFKFPLLSFSKLKQLIIIK